MEVKEGTMVSERKKEHKRRGFSLVELLVFVLIVAIFGLAVYPHMLGMYARSGEASVKSNMFTLRIAAENFASMAEGRYPELTTTTVGAVLTALGIPSANPALIADVDPATRATVSTSVNALLPGNATYGNPFWPTANCLQSLAAAVAPGPAQPAHVANPPANASGQGTVYWGPIGTAGSMAMEGYVIYGDGYRDMLNFALRSIQ